MRRRFLPLAAAFSMMAAAGDEQQAVASREALPAPSGERFDGDSRSSAALEVASVPRPAESTPTA